MDTAKNRDQDAIQFETQTTSSIKSIDELNTIDNKQNKDTSEDDSVKSNTPMYSSRKRKDIHESFFILKKQLNLESFQRKTQIDSLLKKCKSKAFKTIHQALKNCLRSKLERLPQSFITNINIEFNKDCLNKTIYEIYMSHNLIEEIEKLQQKNYIIEDKVELFKNFLSLSFQNVFEFYLSSKQYVKDYEHIQKREGEGLAVLFNYVSKIFVPYFQKFRGNVYLEKKELKSTKENSSVCNSEESEEDSQKIQLKQKSKFIIKEEEINLEKY